MPETTPVFIAEYLGAQAPILPMAALPLPEEQVKPFINADAVVHFTVAIPLEDLICGHDHTADYIRQFFVEELEFSGLEFRAVGANYDEFDKPLCGDVLLQCTCTLHLSE